MMIPTNLYLNVMKRNLPLILMMPAVILQARTENNVTTEWLYEDEQWKDLLTSFDGQTITYDEIGNPLTYRETVCPLLGKRTSVKTSYKADETVSYQYNSSGLRTQKDFFPIWNNCFLFWKEIVFFPVPTVLETIYFIMMKINRAIAMRVNDTMYAFEHNAHGD